MSLLDYEDRAEKFSEVHRRILSKLRQIRRNSSFENRQPNSIVKHDIRIGHLNGKPIERFVLHLRSNGCAWSKENTGCTMCGFWNETTQNAIKITENQFVNQIRNAINEFNLKSYPVLCLYNAGSFFHEHEIPFTAVEKIVSEIANNIPHLKRLIVESRIDHLDQNKLRAIQSILGNQTQLAVGLGLESENDIVRNVLINKGISKSQFESSIELLKRNNTYSIVYLLIKPPFLTEQEAIIDSINSAKYAVKLGANEINFETMTIQKNTLVHLLYEQEHYQLPWLWSVIKILESVSVFAKAYLTPFSYIIDSEMDAHNCNHCTTKIREKIYKKYCVDFNISHIENLDCICKLKWREILKTKRHLSVDQRISEIIEILK